MAKQHYDRKTMSQSMLEAISDGTTLREWCRDNGIAFRTIYNWIAEDEDLATRFARARETGAHAIAGQAFSELLSDNLAVDDRGRLDPSAVQLKRIRFEGTLKLLSKWAPKGYGEKLEIKDGAKRRKLSEKERALRIKALLAKAEAEIGNGEEEEEDRT